MLAWATDELDRFATGIEQATRDTAPDEAVGALLIAACRHLASDDHELSMHVMHASLSPEGAAVLKTHTARLVEVFARTLRPVAARKFSAEVLARRYWERSKRCGHSWPTAPSVRRTP